MVDITPFVYIAAWSRHACESSDDPDHINFNSECVTPGDNSLQNMTRTDQVWIVRDTARCPNRRKSGNRAHTSPSGGAAPSPASPARKPQGPNDVVVVDGGEGGGSAAAATWQSVAVVFLLLFLIALGGVGWLVWRRGNRGGGGGGGSHVRDFALLQETNFRRGGGGGGGAPGSGGERGGAVVVGGVDPLAAIDI
jgi:hypothetical protein